MRRYGQHLCRWPIHTVTLNNPLLFLKLRTFNIAAEESLRKELKFKNKWADRKWNDSGIT